MHAGVRWFAPPLQLPIAEADAMQYCLGIIDVIGPKAAFPRQVNLTTTSINMAQNSPEMSTLNITDLLEELRTNPPTKDPKTFPSENVGAHCDTKILYEGPKKCDCCINWVEQYPSNIKESTEQESDVRRHAIVCRVQKAHRDSKEPLELHSIIIQSPVLKSILGDIFAGYPGITTTLKDVKFRKPFWEFFYFWKPLSDAQAHSKPGSKEHEHLNKLLETLTSQLSNTHTVANDLIQNRVVTYDYLWILFAPGTLLYSRLFDQDCLLEVKRTDYHGFLSESPYQLRCRYIERNGESLGWKTKLIEIPKFSGTKPIQELEVYPITYHQAPEDMRSRFLERGRKFLSFSDWHHKAYVGVIHVSGESPFGSDKLRIDERIVIDAQAFTQHTERGLHREHLLNPVIPDSNVLPDHHIMLCSPVVKAYCLRTKCWGYVSVEGISDIKWDEHAFHNLVLENGTKRLIESFVLAQTKRNDSLKFDDIIEGKGQGMIMLLTGEPGVGKTLTAETGTLHLGIPLPLIGSLLLTYIITVAEKACRPLYMVSAGELGASSRTVERGLTKAFDLANRWNAVLLLDESDVFLEERTSENLERNQLVSVFLRMLEYYRGMMFLTTNRLSVFDPAFQSRIHLTIHYNNLDQESRRKIWQVLLKHAQAQGEEEFAKGDLVALSKEDINGRQIKNAVKAAQLLAAAEEVPLNVTHINTALRVMRNGRSPKAANNGLASFMRWLAGGFGATK
ncbi:hypothetical protein O1611_g1564 [Lasiodiplodia mahajangana]|uniref:Uncharacterized protein n=1 Tax=Lasiodiplodia mahajangana TaxID=1108764 RepID=A0ACC2JX37_9PEZI|nr:hypothetical protein O1611_g1564 [Lasiodiplodia mahajangana]